VTADSDRLARLALAHLAEPGHHGVARAVVGLGAVEVVDRLRRGAPVPGLSPAAREGARLRAEGHDPSADLARLERCGARVVCPGDGEWPAERLTWDDSLPYAAPLCLLVRGVPQLAETVADSVSVVGARAATAYGELVAGELAAGVTDRGWSVVSGAAYGIDGAAHRGALASGRAPTVAVLACGVDVAYPRGHDRLLGQIAAQGLVISEWPPGSAPTRVRFLVRNRVIAALSRGTVVVEAAARSGSLSTAARATELSKPVMAVPGPVTSAMAGGSNELLRAGATCVTRYQEVLETVGRLGDDALEPRRGPEDPRDQLSQTVRQVLEAVPVRGGSGEAVIARAAGVSALVVQQVLPPLLVAGLVERTADGWRLTALGAGRPARSGRARAGQER
jgi:DNA processing protein